jgi:hypothetical protein
MAGDVLQTIPVRREGFFTTYGYDGARAIQRVLRKGVQHCHRQVSCRIPLKVQIVISRWEGDRRASNQPDMLTVNASPSTSSRPGALSRLRIGAEVPVSAAGGSPDTAGPGAVGGAAPVQYRPIGTNIDCTAHATDDKRYVLQIAIEDSSVYAAENRQPGMVSPVSKPIFRTFRILNTAVMADGQSIQFTSAADKIGGDLVKVDVTVNVAQ